MICPKCNFEQSEGNLECPKCGIIFAKFKAFQERQQELDSGAHETDATRGTAEATGLSLKELFCPLPGNISYLIWGGRAFLFLVIVVWGMMFMFSSIDSNYAGKSFLHLINLPFHEAGHIFFRPFGSFITSLGGSLGQLLIPLVCSAVLLLKTRDAFGAAVCFWWFGQNFFDLAPYINDARSGSLPLIGGNFGHSSPYGFHDWEYLLTESGLLRYDHLIANMAFGCGTVVMLISFFWSGYLLLMQYRHCR